ncbi:MAG: hypothetical protein ACTSSH_09055, partial [Candidatus Heimdallarchaeota archaeon]
MFKLKKLSNKALLVGISIFNIIILISFIVELFINSNILPNSLIILALPVELISSNILIVIAVLVIEGLLIALVWIRSKKGASSENSIDESFEFDFLSEETDSNETVPEINRINTEDVPESNIFEDEESWDQPIVLDYNEVTQQAEIEESSRNDYIDNPIIADEEDFDISPGFLASINEPIQEEVNESLISKVSTNPVKTEQLKRPSEIVNDYQFAIYQNIVNNVWLYDKARDRNRIGFEHNAIDESQIPLSELSRLMKSGLIYKQIIQHPTGQFTVYASNPNAEKQIIIDYVRRVCRKKRFKLISRKIEFVNWQEFGLKNKIWQFDLEITDSAIIGLIWTNDSFSISE